MLKRTQTLQLLNTSEDSIFAMIDDSITGLKDKIFVPGMENLKNLENVLLSGNVSQIICKYIEFHHENLVYQLKLFR